MQPIEAGTLASVLYHAVAGPSGSRLRGVLAGVVVALAVAISVPLVLVAFLAPLVLFARVAGSTFPTRRETGGFMMSGGAAVVVTLAFLIVAFAVCGIARRRASVVADRTDSHSDSDGSEPSTAEAEPVEPPARDVAVRTGGRTAHLTILAELAVYAVTALVLMWPVSLHLGAALAGKGDVHYYAWLTWRVGQLLRHGSLPLRIPDVVWPYGLDLRLIDGQLPTLVGGLWNVVTSPFLAFNLTLITGTALNLWAGRRLGRLFSSRREVWVLTAIAFATAPAIVTRLEVHVTLYYAFATALLIEEAIHVARGDRALQPVRVGGLLFLAYLCGIYVLVFGAIAFGLIVVLSMTSGRSLAATLLRGILSLGLALVLMSPFLFARVSLERTLRERGRDPVLLHHTFSAEADALSIVAQPGSSTIDLPGAARLRRTFRVPVHEVTTFPGFLLLMGFAGLWFLRTPLRWPLVFSSWAIWLLGLGPSLMIDGSFVVTNAGVPVGWLPYTALVLTPGLGSLRSPNRASFTLAALLAAAAAICLASLLERASQWQRVGICAAGGLLLATNLLIPIHETRIEGGSSLHDALREVAARVQPGESMIDVPADCRIWPVIFQELHHTPVVGCQTSPSAIPWTELTLYERSAALAALRCQPQHFGRLATTFTNGERFDERDLASLQHDFGARFFLIDMSLLGDSCPGVRDALPILERHEQLGDDGRFIVIDVGSPPSTAAQTRRIGPAAGVRDAFAQPPERGDARSSTSAFSRSTDTGSTERSARRSASPGKPCVSRTR